MLVFRGLGSSQQWLVQGLGSLKSLRGQCTSLIVRWCLDISQVKSLVTLSYRSYDLSGCEIRVVEVLPKLPRDFLQELQDGENRP